MRRNYLCFIVFTVSSILFFQAGCPKKAGSAEKPAVESGASIPVVAPIEKPEITPQVGESDPKITFENVVYDIGEIGPGKRSVPEYKFKNTGSGLLKITKVQTCCGVTYNLSKKEYEPGESGVLKLNYKAVTRPTTVRKHVTVHSNDPNNPKVELTIRGRIIEKVKFEPAKLNLLLKEENAACPEITLTSIDKKPFAVKSFESTGDCITADVNSVKAATKFVLKPKVDTEKLRKQLNGFVKIGLTHPSVDEVSISYNTLSEFKINPPVIIAFNAEPQKPVKRDVWVLSNYNEDFEIESTSSKNNIIRVSSQEKVNNGYHLEVEITPPVAETGKKVFTDVFSVTIKGGKELAIACRGFYAHSPSSSSP